MSRLGAMIWSVVILGMLAGVAALVSLVLERWVLLGLFAALFLLVSLIPGLLFRRVDPDELRKFSSTAERLASAWARGMGRASGGWDPSTWRKR